MPNDLVCGAANDRTVVFAAGNVIPGYSRIDFGGGFGRGYGADVDDCTDEAGGVADTGDVRAEVGCW